MNLNITGLTGPVLALKNEIQRVLKAMASVRLNIFQTAADLPNPEPWQGRQVIVRDLDGGGTPGVVTALDGDWIKADGSIV